MLNNCYSFLSHWRVEATPEEVFRVMEDWSTMPQWWPACVVRADVMHPGDADGVGGVFDMHTRGWLPYVIRSQMVTVEKQFPHCFRTRAGGELRGEGTWTFRSDGLFVDIVAEMKLVAEKPVIKYLSFALWPLFAGNHYWSMRLGERSLRLEVARRRARTDRRLIPDPRVGGIENEVATIDSGVDDDAVKVSTHMKVNPD